MDTIFALSSGAPPAAIAVMRISGPDALMTAQALTGPLPADRRATLRTVRDPASSTILDRALILVFRGPTTATGEDLVELHLHGGRAVVAAVAAVLAARGLRRAEPGEFTRRALVNGRIDLTEAEGLGDLLTAETEGQRKAAMTAAQGGVRRRVEHWSAVVLTVSAQIEAELDFADEDDVPAAALETIRATARALAEDIDTVLSQPPIERLRDGIRVVLAGPPNSGKSSLLNAMAEWDAAIVSPIAGTTRDRIEVSVQRNGIAYVITDTAGLAVASDDPIERIGIERAQAAMAAADIVVWLGDLSPPVAALWVHSRADIVGRSLLPPGPLLAISAIARTGISQLWSSIEQRAGRLLPRLDEIALNERQRRLASEARDALTGAATNADSLLIAEDLREARVALDRITGHTDTEAMLDTLFGAFCIGK